ncbi:helix-turn-helix domain-containing protein [Paraburkholderia kururiensis]|uniref:helix-turn-helix domain-containing protein n=1 Tax=Paraburkholderia kururiensis TaxID=984307 RepID=UPI00035FCEE7|nr:XRE family transcriptional regulator [Paraburkholderia kururiensis]
MKISDRYKDAFARAKETSSYWTERTLLDLAGKLLSRMKERGLSQSTLAEKMGKKAPQISRVLSGRHNLTVQSLCEAAFAMDMTVDIRLEPMRKGKQGGQLIATNDAASSAPRSLSNVRVIRSAHVLGGTLNVGAAEQFRDAA